MKKIFLLACLLLSIGQASQAQNGFVGKYAFSESVGKTAGGTGIMYNYQIIIYKENGNYKARYHIDGHQAMTRLNCAVIEVKLNSEAPANSLILQFESFGKDDLFKSEHLYQKGRNLLEISRKGGLMASPDETAIEVTYTDEFPFEEKRGKTYIFQKQ